MKWRKSVPVPLSDWDVQGDSQDSVGDDGAQLDLFLLGCFPFWLPFLFSLFAWRLGGAASQTALSGPLISPSHGTGKINIGN